MVAVPAILAHAMWVRDRPPCQAPSEFLSTKLWANEVVVTWSSHQSFGVVCYAVIDTPMHWFYNPNIDNFFNLAFVFNPELLRDGYPTWTKRALDFFTFGSNQEVSVSPEMWSGGRETEAAAESGENRRSQSEWHRAWETLDVCNSALPWVPHPHCILLLEVYGVLVRGICS